MTSKGLVEIVFHGRGGQGAVTAANLLVASALNDGNKGVQAFPFFGAERRGAPVRAFARISEEEIHLRSEIYNPDIVIVLDESIMDIVDVIKGLKKDGKILINTRKKPKDFEFSKKFDVATVDATGIALKHEILVGGIPVVNTPILGFSLETSRSGGNSLPICFFLSFIGATAFAAAPLAMETLSGISLGPCIQPARKIPFRVD